VLDGADIDDLLKLFDINNKGELRKVCRALTIRQIDLCALILCARSGALESYQYASRFFDLHPSHLTPTPDELTALAQNGIGPLRGKAEKGVTKLRQLLADRRHFAAHLFFVPGGEYWHLFCSDQRDTARVGNRWKHGAHIHFASYLTTSLSLAEVWQHVRRGSRRGLGEIHIRYQHV